MASRANYARRRRNAFLAAAAMALIFIIIVIVIIVSLSNKGGNSGNIATATPTFNANIGDFPTISGNATPTPTFDTNIGDEPTPTPTGNAGTIMYVTSEGGAVNVRKEASASSEKLTSLAKGTQVTAYEKSGDFYRVKLSSGDYGYISDKYLSTEDPKNNTSTTTTPSATPDTSSGKTMYAKTGVRVRSSAENKGDANIITSVKAGAKVTAYVTKSGWTYVQYATGKYGYISADYLVEQAPNSTTPTPTPTATATAKPAQQAAGSWLEVGLPQALASELGTSYANYLAITPSEGALAGENIPAGSNRIAFKIKTMDSFTDYNFYYITVEKDGDQYKNPDITLSLN